MQYTCGITNATSVHGHIDDLLLDLRRLPGVSIFQEKCPSTPQETLPAPIALLALSCRAMSYNIRAVTVGAAQDLEHHEATLSC